jgi:D-methionine transport system ATP-binding protein
VALFIEIKNVSKKFKNHNQKFDVLNDINLEIQKGDIFGIIGFSGVGKSTLIRCMNGLETVSSGTIRIDNHEIDKLSKKEMNLYRQKIGTIFQHFNLFDSRTVYDNVAFPLEVSGKNRREIKKRVTEVLELVSMSDKKDFYPGQLSGGQKQRVSIARALANNPDILLSDEATSALDPVTSLSVLDLLKDINKSFGLTIILITHSLDVIKYICNNMAVLEDGLIGESGSIREIFAKPLSKTAKMFIKNNYDLAKFDYFGGLYEGI